MGIDPDKEQYQYAFDAYDPEELGKQIELRTISNRRACQKAGQEGSQYAYSS